MHNKCLCLPRTAFCDLLPPNPVVIQFGTCGLQVHHGERERINGGGTPASNVIYHLVLPITVHGPELVSWPRKIRNFKGALEIAGAHTLLNHKN